MSEVIGYTISSKNGDNRLFLTTDSQSGYPCLVCGGFPRRRFYTKDKAEEYLVNNSTVLKGYGIPEVVEVSVNVVSTLSTIDRNQVTKKAALAKLTDEERKVLGV